MTPNVLTAVRIKYRLHLNKKDVNSVEQLLSNSYFLLNNMVLVTLLRKHYLTLDCYLTLLVALCKFAWTSPPNVSNTQS